MASDPATAYVEATAARLASDGCQVGTEDWSGTQVLIGYRSDFRLRWMATKLHLFTIVAPATAVAAGAIEAFTNSTMDYALGRKGAMRGLQSGVAVLPCLVSPSVEPGELAWARKQQRIRFACMARPVVVDTSTGEVGCFRGSATLGRIYAGHLRRKLDLYFPPVNAGHTAGQPGSAS
jgi:hypothetical protein